MGFAYSCCYCCCCWKFLVGRLPPWKHCATGPQRSGRTLALVDTHLQSALRYSLEFPLEATPVEVFATVAEYHRSLPRPRPRYSTEDLVRALCDLEALGGGRLCLCCQPLPDFRHAGGDHGVEETSECVSLSDMSSRKAASVPE